MFQPAPPKSNPSANNKKTKAQSNLQVIAKQVLQEPFEIAKVASEQILTVPPVQAKPQDPHTPTDTPDVQKLQRKEARHIQAFREELQEIKSIQQKRINEFRQNKFQEQQQQQQADAQAKQQESPIDIPGKQQKRGMLGAVKKKVSNMLEAFQFKKPRGVETQKMPSG